jgi:hypothetical protein
LIKVGHSWSEIQDYSYGQIKLFIESALTIEAEERRFNLIQSAIAAQGDSKAIKSAIKDLGG